MVSLFDRKLHHDYQPFSELGGDSVACSLSLPNNRHQTRNLIELLPSLWCASCRRQKVTNLAAKKALSSMPGSAPSRSKPVYYIISEVGSDVISLEQEDGMIPPKRSQYVADGTRRCSRLTMPFRHCFSTSEFVYDYDLKEVETITMSAEEYEEETIYPVIDDDAIVQDPPFVFRISSNSAFAPFDYSSKIIGSHFPAQSHSDHGSTLLLHSSLWEKDRCPDPTDNRDDDNTFDQLLAARECLQLILPPDNTSNLQPLLGIAFPHPAGDCSILEDRPTLGIHSAPPHWIEQERNNFWEDMVIEPFDDTDHFTLPSPIQVETTCNKEWIESPSEILTVPTTPEENEGGEQGDFGSFPSLWSTRIYGPITRFAKGITACGQLQDSVSVYEEAPFDEVQDDLERRPFDKAFEDFKPKASISQFILRPNPKDSPSLSWLRDHIGLGVSPFRMNLSS